MSREEAKLAKVRVQLDGFLAEEKFYEAQQLFQSLYFRYSGRKKFEQAAILLHEGALKLAQHKQIHSAAQLAELLVECYSKAGTSADHARIGQLVEISDAFVANGEIEDANGALIKFLKTAIQWTTTAGAHPQGDPLLHLSLARAYVKQEDFGRAQRQYLRAGTPEECADMLLKWRHLGYRSEQDLYVARCVLELLCLENLKDANLVFQRFLAGCPCDTPLAHFIEFLLMALERDAAPLFATLREKYSVALLRDDSFKAYLDKIGELFFGLKVQAGGLAGLFKSIGM